MLEDLDVVLGVVAASEQELEIDLRRLGIRFFRMVTESDRVIAALQHPESHVAEHREDHLGWNVLEHVRDIESEFIGGPFRNDSAVGSHVVAVD